MKTNLICRVSSVLLIICMLSSVLAIPAYAVESRQVVGRIQISATDCKAAYNAMKNDTSWTDNLAIKVGGIISDHLGEPIKSTYNFAVIVQKMKYRMTMNAFKTGADNGKGCTMILYDNEAPCIIANN